jgi:hypothetical protein
VRRSVDNVDDFEIGVDRGIEQIQKYARARADPIEKI